MKAKRLLMLLASLILATSLIIPVNARIVDPCPGDELLERLAEPLDAVGIDVALGISSDLELADRPRLARLDGYSPRQIKWADTGRFDWVSGFTEGVVGALLATQDDTAPEIQRVLEECAKEAATIDREACSFVKRWLAKDSKQRIFISYTKVDWRTATDIKRIMEKQGYVVFTYLKDEQRDTWADPGLLGVAYSQAGARYVIDSAAARGSLGVRFEELCGAIGALTPVSKWERRLMDGSW